MQQGRTATTKRGGFGRGSFVRDPESSIDSASRTGRQSPLVLVVDDVDDNRDLYATFLEYCGYRVVQAADGEAALATIVRNPPDLIVMDLAMPRMDGWEATRLVKSNPRTQGIFVLVLTGHAMQDDLDRARAAGADAIVTKPCLPAQLVAAVEDLLAGRSSRLTPGRIVRARRRR